MNERMPEKTPKEIAEASLEASLKASLEEIKTKVLAVAIVGAPNVGKSTLANRLSGRELSITSRRPQTTVRIIHSVFNHGNTQIMLSDTPGLAKNLRHSVAEAKSADHTLLVVDCRRPLIDEGLRFDTLIINKCDKCRLTQINELAERHRGACGVFAISALGGKGVEDLKQFLLTRAVVGNWFYPKGVFTNLTDLMQAEEFTREQLLRRLKYELPYEVVIKTKEFGRENNQLRISQQLISGKSSRKKIIIGSGGKMLKSIGESARKNMERHFACRVHLFLQVS